MRWCFHVAAMERAGATCMPTVPCRWRQPIGDYGNASLPDLIIYSGDPIRSKISILVPCALIRSKDLLGVLPRPVDGSGECAIAIHNRHTLDH
jgi:hypothetical protein